VRGKITGGAYSSLRNGTGKWPVQRLLIKHSPCLRCWDFYGEFHEIV